MGERGGKEGPRQAETQISDLKREGALREVGLAWGVLGKGQGLPGRRKSFAEFQSLPWPALLFFQTHRRGQC